MSLIRRPRVRNAVSRIRSASVAKSYSISRKISLSGMKVIVVPVIELSAPLVSSFCGLPRTYSCVYSLPSVLISRWSRSDSALTTETPTPCRPPDTL